MSQGKCGLTNVKADFVNECTHFIEDKELKTNEIKGELNRSVFRDQASAGVRFTNKLIDCIIIF